MTQYRETEKVNTVRDGQIVWPTCPECGCRVFYHRLWGLEYLAHKLDGMGKDAMGHTCSLLHEYWPMDHTISDRVRNIIGV